MPIAAASFEPDVDCATAIVARVAGLHLGPKAKAGETPVVTGPRAGWDEFCKGFRDRMVFVTASGGSGSRPIKGGAEERHVNVEVRVRADGPGMKTALQDGQALARLVFNALQFNPPTTDYCESRSFDGHPNYIGPDDDGHHEWVWRVELTVDIT